MTPEELARVESIEADATTVRNAVAKLTVMQQQAALDLPGTIREQIREEAPRIVLLAGWTLVKAPFVWGGQQLVKVGRYVYPAGRYAPATGAVPA